MSIFKRIFKMGQAEAHSALDKLENPIKLTEQGIRDLKIDLDKAMKSLAELKAMEIRTRREIQDSNSKAGDYERKAMAIIKKAQSGGMDAAEADRLATEALNLKEQSVKHAQTLNGQLEQHSGAVNRMEANVKTLRSKIATWENELRTLKARHKVSQASAKLNKQMANIDSSGTLSMLEKMKEKVESQEALAESYGEIAHENKSLDDAIDEAASDTGGGSAALEELKRKMAEG